MSKIYEKPEVVMLSFELSEAIADEDVTIPGLSMGNEGSEVWP